MSARRPRRWLRNTLIAPAALLVLWTAFGFLLAPRLLRDALQTRGSAALRRPVTVAAVEVNPLVLSVTVRGLRVGAKDGGQLAAWEALHVHMDAHNCLEVLVLRGKAGDVQRMGSELASTRGVKFGKFVPATTGRDLR